MKRLKRLIRRPKKSGAPDSSEEQVAEQSFNHTASSQLAANPRHITVSEPIATPQGERPSGVKISRGLFKYTPLKHVYNFRILHLQRKSNEYRTKYKELTLQGSMIEASLNSFPEYVALSYTWGDPVLCEDIVIDRKLLKVTASCASALRRMLRGKADRTIWVDSICINQSSDPEALEERSKQVAIMDEIYRNAVQVNVHLGDGDDASDVACQALKSLSQAYLTAKTPGPQQEAGRIEYERLADDTLGKCPVILPIPSLKEVQKQPQNTLMENCMVYFVYHGSDVLGQVDSSKSIHEIFPS